HLPHGPTHPPGNASPRSGAAAVTAPALSSARSAWTWPSSAPPGGCAREPRSRPARSSRAARSAEARPERATLTSKRHSGRWLREQQTDTCLGERYRPLIKRMPKAKALAAIERSILVIIFHLVADPSSSFED